MEARVVLGSAIKVSNAAFSAGLFPRASPTSKSPPLRLLSAPDMRQKHVKYSLRCLKPRLGARERISCAQCGSSGQPVRPGAAKSVQVQAPPRTVSAPLISGHFRFSILQTGTASPAEACRRVHSALLLSGEVAVTCGLHSRRRRRPRWSHKTW
jgi:hypothetical protein